MGTFKEGSRVAGKRKKYEREGELEEKSWRREDDRNEVWYWPDKISEKNLKTGMDYRPDRI